MCGIFGSVNAGSPEQRQLALMALRTRGVNGSMDGCGLAWPTKKRGWKFAKSGKDFYDALAESDLQHRVWEMPMVLGHVRGASKSLGVGGLATASNAHPHKRGEWLMAHNGYLRNYTGIDHKLKKHKDAVVDSDILCAAIDEWGLKETLPLVSGSASIWLCNVRDTSGFLLWCWDQDLWIWTGNGSSAFASEQGALHIAGFNGKNGTLNKVEPKEGALYKFNADGTVTRMESIAGVPELPARTYHRGAGFGWDGDEDYQDGVYVGRPVAYEWAGFSVGNSVNFYSRHERKRIEGHVVVVDEEKNNLEVRDTKGVIWVVGAGLCSRSYTPAAKDSSVQTELPIRESDTSVYMSSYPPSSLKNAMIGTPIVVCARCNCIGKVMAPCPGCGMKLHSIDVRNVSYIGYCLECTNLFAAERNTDSCPSCDQPSLFITSADAKADDYKARDLIYAFLCGVVHHDNIRDENTQFLKYVRAMLPNEELKAMFDEVLEEVLLTAMEQDTEELEESLALEEAEEKTNG